MTIRWGTRDWFADKFATQGFTSPGAYFAHSTNGYQRDRHWLIRARLRSVLNTRLTGALLDIGCGTGALTAGLASDHCFDRVVGVDFTDRALEVARQSYPE